MITCIRTKEQKIKFLAKVTSDLKAIQSDPTKTFDLKSYIRSIYDAVLNKTNNKHLAVNYARLTPSYLNKAQANNEDVLIDLLNQGFDTNAIFNALKSFRDKTNGLTNASEFIGIGKTELRKAVEEFEQKEEDDAKEKAEQEYIDDNSVPFRQRPINALSTTINELLDPNDHTQGRDPRMAYYTQFVKNILSKHVGNRQSPEELSGIKYTGVEGGLHLAFMSRDKIPAEQRYSGVTTTEPYVYVVTDKNGKPVLFDANYNVTSTGKYIYYNARFLPKKVNGKFDYSKLTNVQQPKEIADNLGITLEEATQKLDAEFELLEQSQQFINANPNGFLLGSMLSGSFGGVVFETQAFVNPSEIAEAQVESIQFYDKTKAAEATGLSTSLSGTYVKFINMPRAYRFKANKVKDNVEIKNTIISLLKDAVKDASGKVISASQKKTEVIGLLGLANLKNQGITLTIDSETKKIIVKKNNQEVTDISNLFDDMNLFVNQKYITDNINNLSRPIVSEDNVLTYKSYKNDAKAYLGEIGTVNVALDNNKKIEEYNPYFNVSFLADQLTKLREGKSAPVPSAEGPLEIPIETAARIDLVNLYGYQQGYVDKLTTQQVIEEYEKAKQEKSGQADNALKPEKFNNLGVKEKHETLVTALRDGETITGKIEKPTDATTGYNFTFNNGSKVTFYNTPSTEVKLINADDITKKATLILVDKVTTPQGAVYENVIQVFVGDKYIGNVRVSSDQEFEQRKKEALDKAAAVVDAKQDESSADQPVPTSKDKIAELLKKKKDLGLEKKPGQTAVQATLEQIKEAEQWYKSSPLSKYIPFKVMFNVINTKRPGSVATWDVNGITLFQGSDYSDLYHEAWHGFTQMFMTKDQRKALYAEARTKKGTFKSFLGREVSYADATLLELEEQLAENFREYVLSDGKKTWSEAPVKNKLFKWLLDLLNRILGRPTIDQLYEKLRVGNIHEYTFNQKNAEFEILDSRKFIPQTLEKDQLNTLSREDAQLMSDTVDGLFGEYIDTLIEQDTPAWAGLYQSQKGLIAGYEYAETRLVELLENKTTQRQKLLDENKDADTEEIDNDIQLLSYSIKNFGDSKQPGNTYGLVNFHYNNSSDLHHADVEMSDFEAVNLNEKNPFEKNSGADVSMMGLADSYLIYTLKTLPKTDKNNKVQTNRLGGPMIVDMDKLWARLTNITEGSVNVIDLSYKLNELKNDYPELGRLLKRLGTLQESTKAKSNMRLWSALEKIATMPRIATVSAYLKVSQKKNEQGQKTESVTVVAKKSQGEFGKVGKSWDNRFSSRNDEYVTKNQATNTVSLDINKVLKDFSKLTIDNVFDFMAAIGAPLETGPLAMQSFKNENILKAIDSGIYRALISIRKYNNEFPTKQIVIRKPSDIVFDYVKNYKEGLDPSIDKNLKTSLSGGSKKYELIQKWQLKWSDEFTDTTVSNASGDNIYERSQRSTASNNITYINDSPTLDYLTQIGSMNHWDMNRNPFVETTIYANRLYELNTPGKKKRSSTVNGVFSAARIRLENMSGLTREVSDINSIIEYSGVASSSADPIAKRLELFYMTMLYGISESVKMADKSTTYLYAFEDVDGKISPIQFTKQTSYDDTKPYILNVANNEVTGINEVGVTDVFMGYLASEMARIGKLKTGDEAGNVIVGKKTYKEVGSKLVTFKKILKDLNATDYDAIENKSFTTVKEAKEFLYAENNKALREKVQESIMNYLKDLAATEDNFFNEIGFSNKESLYKPAIEKMLPAGVTYNMLSSQAKASYVKNMSLAYIVNSWIHKYESTVLLLGDPALYVNVDDFFKRDAGLNSTGDFPRHDQFMAEFINNKQKEASYAATRGLAPKNWTDTMDSAVMQDAVTDFTDLEEYIKIAHTKEEQRLKNLNKSKTEIEAAKEEITKIFNGAYKGMKEGDGQGWISFDAYRALLMSLNKWSNYQEGLYRKIINKEDISNVNVLEFFPVKKMQMFGALKTNGLPVYGFHKYSLLPLIPNMITDSNLEILHNKMVDQGVDYSLFQSGSKLNTITTNGKLDPFYNHSSRQNETGEFDDTLALTNSDYQFTKNTIFLDNFKDQLEVSTVYKGKNTFSTQLRKLIEEGLMENGVPTDWKPELTNPVTRYNEWNKLTLDQQKKEDSKNYQTLLIYEGLLGKLVNLHKEALRKEIKDSPEKLIEFVKNELTRKELADNNIDSVGKNPFDLSLEAESIEKILVAIVEKRLINQKVNGEALVQVSGVGFEKPGSLRNATKEEIAKYGNNGLTFYKYDKSGTRAMKIKISMQGSFKQLLNIPDVIAFAKEKGISRLDALNIKIKDEQWLNQSNHRRMITSVAVRIPVQGLNSMEFMEVFEFLPESSGNIIVLPAGIVAKSGGDFDIDKMYTLFPNLEVETKLTGEIYNSIPELKAKVKYEELRRLVDLRDKGNQEDVDNLSDKDKDILATLDKYGDRMNVVKMTTGNNFKGVENDLLVVMAQILSMESNFVKLVTPNTTTTMETIARDMAKINRGTQTQEHAEIFEITTNIYKQQSNSIGKAVLGIIAVANTFSTLFNRSGLLMEEQGSITEAPGGVKVMHRQKLLVPHNQINELISLSSLYSADGQKMISDLISQLINGSVDVAKDAWIFDIQGHKQAINALLFMVMSGTPPRHAIAFLSQPILQDYFKEIEKQKSLTNVPLGLADPGNFYRIKSRDNIIGRMKEVDGQPESYYGFDFDLSDVISEKGGVSKGLVFQQLERVADQGADALMDLSQLEANLKNKDKKEYSDLDRAVFAHFLEIMEMSNKITQITQTLNFDTAKSRTLLNVRLKEDKVETLANGISQATINKLMTDSPIAAFGIGEFIIELFDGLFPLRDNAQVTDYIKDMIKYVPGVGSTLSKVVDKTIFSDEDSYLQRWRNDIISYLFQRDYYGLEKKLTTYGNLPIKYVMPGSLDKGVGLKDGVLYVDPKSVETIYQAYPTSYRSLFEFYDNEGEKNKNIRQELFLRFLLESELQFNKYKDRVDEIKTSSEYKSAYDSMSVDLDEETKELKAFNTVMANKALDVLNLHKDMFYGKRAIAQQIIELNNTHPELFEKYSFLNELEIDVSERNKELLYNLRVKGVPTLTQKNVYSDNFEKLLDKSVRKAESNSENERINTLFERLVVFALLQSGTDTSSTLSLVSYIPNEKYVELTEKAFKNFLDTSSTKKKEILDEYTKAFNKQYGKRNKYKAKKIKAYATPTMDPLDQTFMEPYEIEGAVDKVVVQPTTPTVAPTQPSTQEQIVVESTGPIKNPGTEFQAFKYKYAVGKFDNVVVLKSTGQSKDIYTKAAMERLQQYYPEAVFAFNDTLNDLAAAQSVTTDAAFKLMDPGNVIGIPTKLRYRPTKSKIQQEKNEETKQVVPVEVITYNRLDAVSDNEQGEIKPDVKEAIDLAIEKLIAERERGRMIIFDANGYGQYMRGVSGENKPIAPATFRYLSEKLLRNFGFINPGYIKNEGGKPVLNELVAPSDKDIREFKLNCLRQGK